MIKVIDLTTNEVVGTFESIGEISKEFGIDKGNISKVLNNKLKSCNGFTFVRDEVTTPLRTVKPKEVMNKFEKSLRYNENLTVDELVDAVENCFNWIWDDVVEASNPDSVRQGYFLISELSRIVFNALNDHKLKWRDSSRRWLHEDTIKLNAVKDLLSSRDESDYYSGIESALNQIVTTENSIVRCFWLSLFYQFNKFKNEDKIKYNIENA